MKVILSLEFMVTGAERESHTNDFLKKRDTEMIEKIRNSDT